MTSVVKSDVTFSNPRGKLPDISSDLAFEYLAQTAGYADGAHIGAGWPMNAGSLTDWALAPAVATVARQPTYEDDYDGAPAMLFDRAAQQFIGAPIGVTDVHMPLTVCALIRPATVHDGFILTGGLVAGISHHLSLFVVDGTIKMSTAGSAISISAAIPTAEWSFVAGTWTPAGYRLYVEDELRAKYDGPQTDAAKAYLPRPIVGTSASAGASFFNGGISSIRGNTRALTEAEIKTTRLLMRRRAGL